MPVTANYPPDILVNSAIYIGPTGATGAGGPITPPIDISQPGVSWTPNAVPLARSQGSVTGTLVPASVAAAHVLNLNSDNVDATSSNGLYNLYAGMTVGGNNAKGHRTANAGIITVASATGNITSGWFYTAGNWHSVATANDNGTNGSPLGNLFGGLAYSRLQSGATFWNSVCGIEIDVSADTGSSVAYKIGLQIVQLTTDTVTGSVANYGFSINNQSGGSQSRWDYGITFGAKNGVWAIKDTGTLIGADTTALGGPAYKAAYGMDLTNINITGAPIVSPLITPASSSAAGKIGSVVWDTGFIYVCTATNTWKRAALSTF